ncbi:hypothetical protein DYI42_23285 [Vannielia litorea]|nr:hypothetical protein [Vannielia litorea]
MSYAVNPSPHDKDTKIRSLHMLGDDAVGNAIFALPRSNGGPYTETMTTRQSKGVEIEERPR